jgi:glyoxylate/hydroxypyruvate reductase A
MSLRDDPPEPIALVGRVAPGEEEAWLDALARAMPGERILPPVSIGNPDAVRLAIVADPDPAAVRRFPSLQWVQSLWAGVERLVAEPALASLPIVRMVDPELGRTMAEAVLAWTLYLHREMPAYLAQQRERRWRQLPYVAPPSRRVGLLGLGALGHGAARAIRGAGFPVSGWSSTAKRLEGVACFHGRDGLAAMAAQTDILVCLLPLTPQTRRLVDAPLLELLPPRASLINVGRGPLVDAAALVAALDRGHLSHAVLDVFDEEPLPAGSPLWTHPGITVMPHVAADTDPRTGALVVAANVRAWRRSGRHPDPVDRARGY